jgi:hypothetical protein
MNLREKFSLLRLVCKLRSEKNEEKRLKNVYIDLCVKKTDENAELQRQLDLVWDIYGTDYRQRIEGIGLLLIDIKKAFLGE